MDAMAKQWSGLVLNDYEAVMPLSWNKKYGITYLYQPPFVQQLGIYSKTAVSTAVQELFITAAKQRFRFAEIFVNVSFGEARTNFILPLNRPYQQIRQDYKKDLFKNLKHADSFLLHYEATNDIAAAVDLYQVYYAARTPHVKQRDYEQLVTACATAQQHDMLRIRKVVDEKNSILAIALLLKDNQRLYNILSTVTTAGRQCEANHYLFDQLIQEFSGQQLTLDFEGSSIAGIADFYKKFGAVDEPYFFLRYNHLPWPLKYFK